MAPKQNTQKSALHRPLCRHVCASQRFDVEGKFPVAEDEEQKAKAAARAVQRGASKKKRMKKYYTTTFHRPKTLQHRRNPKYPRISAPKQNKMDHFQVSFSVKGDSDC